MTGPWRPLARALRNVALPRAVALVAVGLGLALGATHLPATINLAKGRNPLSATRPHADPVTQTHSICPGPEALGVEGLPDSLPQAVSVAAVSAPLAALPSGLIPSLGAGSLTMTGVPFGGVWAAPATARGQVILGQISDPRSVQVTAVGSMAPGAVATQWSWTKTGNYRGLVQTACLPGAASSWLIAGGAAPGRLEHLVLANPGPNPLTVDLAVFGAKGRINSPDAVGLVVPGQARTVILLDAIAGSEPSPAVHVSARGGKVAAFLSDTWLDGVVPRGGDDVASVAAPAREQVIAGVPIDGKAILRVAVPGGSEAVVQSRVLTPDGPRPLPADAVTRVAGGSTKDIDLSSLPAGAYAVQVVADVPVLAAVMVDRRRSAVSPSDMAWSVATLPIRTLSGMALPVSGVKGLTQRLDLAATTSAASVRVTTVGAGGQVSTKEIAIGADSVSTLSLDGASSVWVTPAHGVVRAAILTSAPDAAGELLSVTPMTDLTLTTTASPLLQLRD
jgi:Family of unknown function (DUF5719)